MSSIPLWSKFVDWRKHFSSRGYEGRSKRNSHLGQCELALEQTVLAQPCLTPGEYPPPVGVEHLKYELKIAAVWYLEPCTAVADKINRINVLGCMQDSNCNYSA